MTSVLELRNDNVVVLRQRKYSRNFHKATGSPSGVSSTDCQVWQTKVWTGVVKDRLNGPH